MEPKQIAFNANVSNVNNSMSISCSVFFINFLSAIISLIVAYVSIATTLNIKYFKVCESNYRLNLVKYCRTNVYTNNHSKSAHLISCICERLLSRVCEKASIKKCMLFSGGEKLPTKYCNDSGSRTSTATIPNSLNRGCNNTANTATVPTKVPTNSLSCKKIVTIFKIMCILMLISEATALPPIIRIGE